MIPVYISTDIAKVAYKNPVTLYTILDRRSILRLTENQN